MNVKFGKIENILFRDKVQCPRCQFDMKGGVELYKDNLGVYINCPNCDANFNKTVFVVENDREQLRNKENMIFGFANPKSARMFLEKINFRNEDVYIGVAQ